MPKEVWTATCCSKEISFEEAMLNWGMCNVCLDRGVEEANKKQEGRNKE